MLGDQGVLVALFYKERPAGRRQVGARAEESGQMNARLRIHSLLSQHYQRRVNVLFLVEIIEAGGFNQHAQSRLASPYRVSSSFTSARLSLGRLRKPLILRKRGSMSS